MDDARTDAAPTDAQWLLAGASEALLLVAAPGWRIQACSPSVQTLLGHAPAELVGHVLGEFESALSDVFFWDELGNREHVSAESSYRCADGREINVLKQVRRVSQTPALYVVALQPIAADTNGALELAQLNARLSATLEATADALLLEGPQGQILNMNRRFAELWRVPEALLLAHDDAGIMAHVAQQTVSVEPLSTASASWTQRREGAEVRHLADGRVIDCRSHEAYLNDQRIGRVYSYRDLTEVYRVQDQLVAARDAARQATVAKSRFLATMSHEIRTPMNGILGMAQLLQQEELDASTRQDYVQVILNSGQSLLALLNDILDLSKIESGKFQLEMGVVDVAALLRDIGALFGGSAVQKHLQLRCAWHGRADALFRSDAHRLRQMLSNLVGNAIKFTAHGAIEVSAHELPGHGGVAVLEFAVQDSGIGVSDDKLALLFQPFSQADSSTTRQYGGTGLGLSIVRSLAEMLGGEVGVSSRVGEGSRFWFRVRAERMAGSADAAGTATAPTLAAPAALRLRDGLRVLVAEDNPVNQLVIRALLEQLGVQAEVVGDGQQAIDRLQAGPRPALVLMDLNMPGLDGLGAARQWRSLEQTHGWAHLPLVALTADAFEEDRLRSLQAGMDDFLPKPVALEQLRVTLARWLPAA